MKKNLLPPLIIFVFQLSFGQENYTFLDKSGWCCEQYEGTGAIYAEFYISGDTIINDEYFVEINNMYYLTEDTELKKVWYLNHSQKELLYDFSLELLDTFRVELYDTIIGSYIVSQMDNIESLSGLRKRWILNLTDSVIISQGSLNKSLTWIEGIGSTYGPIYPKTIPVDNEFGGWGTCLEGVYSLEKVQVYQGYCDIIGGYFPELCRFITSHIADVELNQVKAYFTVNGDLRIRSHSQIRQLSVYNVSGRIVYNSRFVESNHYIQIPNRWPDGIYLCKFGFYEDKVLSLKILKRFLNP